MREHIRNGIRAGATFGVVITFLALIGFTSTIVVLVGGILGTHVSEGRLVTTQGITNMVIFLGLMGLWAGSLGARPPEEGEDRWDNTLISGLLAGVTSGAIVGIYALIVGLVNAAGIDMRSYLTALTSDAIEALLLGQSPVVGFLLLLILLSAAGVLGASLARFIGRGAWRESVRGWTGGVGQSINGISFVEKARRSPYTQYVVYALVVAFFLILPSYLNRYWNYNMGTVGIYVLLGLGLNIVVGMAGLLDLGYVAFFAIGAYTVALLTAPTPHHLLWSFWVALPIGVVLAALTGILLGIPVLRMRGDYLAIVTLGFGEIIRILSKSDALTSFSGGPRGVRAIAGPVLLGHPFNSEREFMYLIILGCLLLIFITARLQNSRVGRAWIAMREDETVAQAMGINTWQYKLMAFAIGAAFAGLGGIMFASRNQFTGPEDHNLMVSINVLCLVIVGGMGSIPGIIMGSLALKGLPEALRQLESFRMLAFGALLVVMMIVRPEGIWPSRRRQLEMHKSAIENPTDDPEMIPGGDAP